MKVLVIPVVICALATIPKGLLKELGGMEIRGQVETIQTTALRSSRILRKYGDLRILAVTQTPVRNRQLRLVWRTLKEFNIKDKKWIFNIMAEGLPAYHKWKIEEIKKKKKRIAISCIEEGRNEIIIMTMIIINAGIARVGFTKKEMKRLIT